MRRASHNQQETRGCDDNKSPAQNTSPATSHAQVLIGCPVAQPRLAFAALRGSEPRRHSSALAPEARKDQGFPLELLHFREFPDDPAVRPGSHQHDVTMHSVIVMNHLACGKYLRVILRGVV